MRLTYKEDPVGSAPEKRGPKGGEPQLTRTVGVPLGLQGRQLDPTCAGKVKHWARVRHWGTSPDHRDSVLQDQTERNGVTQQHNREQGSHLRKCRSLF